MKEQRTVLLILSTLSSEQLLDLDAQPPEMQRHIQEGREQVCAFLCLRVSRSFSHRFQHCKVRKTSPV